MKKRQTRANVFILDCCRTFVYGENRGSSPKSETGRTGMTTDSLYAFATAPNHPADDGRDGHGMDLVEGGERISSDIDGVASARFQRFPCSLPIIVYPNE